MLDTLPGEVRAGDVGGKDHPAQLIAALQRMPAVIPNRSAVLDHLSQHGFSLPIARWMTTNLRPAAGPAHVSSSGLRWGFDLDGVADMYSSYESTSMWPVLQSPPQGLKIDFVRAEGSQFRWGGGDETGIRDHGHRVHLLRDSGHWVHTDNPGGLFDILAPTFGSVDLHMQHTRPNVRH